MEILLLFVGDKFVTVCKWQVVTVCILLIFTIVYDKFVNVCKWQVVTVCIWLIFTVVCGKFPFQFHCLSQKLTPGYNFNISANARNRFPVLINWNVYTFGKLYLQQAKLMLN